MTQPINKNNFAKLRIANFTSIELSLTHVLNVDSQDVQLTLAELRKYADLPYVYILTKEHIKRYKEHCDEGWEWGFERNAKVGDIHISGNSDNSIPYEFWNVIEDVFKVERYHLG